MSEIRECHMCETRPAHEAEQVIHDGAMYTLYTCSMCGTMTRGRPRLTLVDAIGKNRRERSAKPVWL